MTRLRILIADDEQPARFGMAKALAKSPDTRYETCAEFVSLIARALQ